MEYISVEEAIKLPGLRIAFTRGVPGPWGMAAKEFFVLKKIPFVAVAQEGGQANEALQAWTGQNSAPVAVYENERPRAHWSEILMLAERLAPAPRLIPADEDQRAQMFGIAHTICGEDGFGWNSRILMVDGMERAMGVTRDNTPFAGMRRKFTSDRDTLDRARARITSILAMLARRLQSQRAAGSAYLVGDALSAADIYWTAFSVLAAPMEEADCPPTDVYKNFGLQNDKVIGGTVPAALIEHRDRILRDHFRLPLQF